MTKHSSGNTESPLRIGFVGCGHQARGAWYPNFAQLPEAKLVACCDLQPGLAAKTAHSFGADRSYTSLAKMLADEELDAAMVVGPASMHEECARACLEAGLHTITEKPLASSVAKAEALTALASSKGLITQVGHNMRYAPLVQKLREMVRRPEFGKLLHVESRYHMPGPGWFEKGPEGWTTPEDPDGWFYLLVQGVHPIDLARDIGGEITHVHASLSDFGREDRFVLVALVVFASGARGTITLTGSSANWSTRLEVVGDAPATLRLTDLNHLVHEPDGPEAGYFPPYGVPSEVWTTPTRDDGNRRAGYLGQMESFVRAVRDGRPSRPTFDDACRAMRVCEGMLESIRTNAVVSIQEEPT